MGGEQFVMEFSDEPVECSSEVGYLARKTLTGAVHFWDGEDTACRAVSGGGIKISKYQWFESQPHDRMCQNCIRNRSMAEAAAQRRSHTHGTGGWALAGVAEAMLEKLQIAD